MPSRTSSRLAANELAIAVARSSGPVRYSIRNWSSAVQSLKAADQPGQDVARLLERPDAALGDVDVVDRLALPLHRIGGQQVVERGRIFVALLDDDQFRHAARKHVAAEPVAVDQARRRVAHGFEPLQPELQHGGQFLAALAVVAGLLGDQQLRLEEGQPRRHDQIVGREFQPELSRALDEDQILLGERQDRNAREIDLLVARKVQQQVERPFEAGDIDDQRRIAGDARIVVLGPQTVHRCGLSGLAVQCLRHLPLLSLRLMPPLRNRSRTRRGSPFRPPHPCP